MSLVGQQTAVLPVTNSICIYGCEGIIADPKMVQTLGHLLHILINNNTCKCTVRSREWKRSVRLCVHPAILIDGMKHGYSFYSQRRTDAKMRSLFVSHVT